MTYNIFGQSRAEIKAEGFVNIAEIYNNVGKDLGKTIDALKTHYQPLFKGSDEVFVFVSARSKVSFANPILKAVVGQGAGQRDLCKMIDKRGGCLSPESLQILLLKNQNLSERSVDKVYDWYCDVCSGDVG